MSHTEDFEKWGKTAILKIIKNLGQDADDVQYEVQSEQINFISIVYFVCVKFKNGTKGQSEELSIVMKRPMQIEWIRQAAKSDFQFHNEILFYRMYAQLNENFAECYYVDERPPLESVIALENVTSRGYYSCPSKYSASLEYILAGIRELGRFHGKGYVMKELQREKFFAIVEQLQEARYDAMTNDSYKNFIDTIATRAVEYLRNHGHDVTFCDKMEALLSNAFDEVMLKTVEPREPLSTLCHGDFTLSNTLFKAENEGQYRAMLIDFALCRYATPVVDLSTYLCLSCSNEVRKDKFSEIMRAYHDALKGYLLEAGISNIEKYSYDALLEDYKRGVLFGFVITSYFLPTLMGNVASTDVEQLGNEDSIDRAKKNKELGGDEMSKILADILLDLRDLGCLKYFL